MPIAEGKEAAMNCARIVGLALSFCVLPASAPALSDPPINYTSRIWQMQDGLPEQTVQAFAQTKNRYLWIGTTGGLIRFI
jgi:ligand-binding sensor domain-containing protein